MSASLPIGQSARSATILVVDDEPDLFEDSLLEQNGFDIQFRAR